MSEEIQSEQRPENLTEDFRLTPPYKTDKLNSLATYFTDAQISIISKNARPYDLLYVNLGFIEDSFEFHLFSKDNPDPADFEALEKLVLGKVDGSLGSLYISPDSVIKRRISVSPFTPKMIVDLVKSLEGETLEAKIVNMRFFDVSRQLFEELALPSSRIEFYD